MWFLVAPELVVDVVLAALAAYIVALGLKKGYHYTLGAFLLTIAALIPTISLGPIGRIGGANIAHLSHKIEASIASLAHGFESRVGGFFHGLNTLVHSTYSTMEYGFSQVALAFHNLTHATIPAIVEGATAPARTRADRRLKTLDERQRAEARARAAGIEAGVRDLTTEKLARQHGIDAVRKGSKAYTDSQAGRLQGQIARERAYSHKVLGGRISWLERLLGVGVIGGIAVAALTRVFPYWQCSNVRRFMRGLCRSPLGSLDWLFALAALAALSLNPDPVVKALPYAEHVFGGLADDFVGLMRGRADPADVARADARSPAGV